MGGHVEHFWEMQSTEFLILAALHPAASPSGAQEEELELVESLFRETIPLLLG